MAIKWYKLNLSLCFSVIIRKALVRLFNKLEQGTLKEGNNLSNRVIEMHRRRYFISYQNLWSSIRIIFIVSHYGVIIRAFTDNNSCSQTYYMMGVSLLFIIWLCWWCWLCTGKAPRGREKVPFQEPGAQKGFVQKNPFTWTLYQIVYVKRNCRCKRLCNYLRYCKAVLLEKRFMCCTVVTRSFFLIYWCNSTS